MNALTRYSPFRSTVWDPIRELENVENRLSRFLQRPIREFEKETGSFSEWAPSVDIYEDEKEFLVKAELPEIKKEDVKVSVEDGMLQISGERKMEKEEKGKNTIALRGNTVLFPEASHCQRERTFQKLTLNSKMAF